jgi:hypothetical protein
MTRSGGLLRVHYLEANAGVIYNNMIPVFTLRLFAKHQGGAPDPA